MKRRNFFKAAIAAVVAPTVIAESVVHQLKLEKLEELKLQILATNPQILGIRRSARIIIKPSGTSSMLSEGIHPHYRTHYIRKVKPPICCERKQYET
jgi:hypothetical protein